MATRKRSEYKLHYFNAKGRAEVSRLVLAYAKIHFDDIRYEREEWPAVKSKMPTGQMPVLEWKGQMLPQSRAIARFLAGRHGLMGTDEWQAARIDALIDFVGDVANEFMPVFRAKMAGGDAAEESKVFIEKHLVPCLLKMEEMIFNNGSGFIVGNQITLADLVVFNFVDMASDMLGSLMPKSPHVTKLCSTIGDVPAIKEWLNRRPATPF